MSTCKLEFYFHGANKINGTWVWTDNSNFNYTHWINGNNGNWGNLNNPYAGYRDAYRYGEFKN